MRGHSSTAEMMRAGRMSAPAKVSAGMEMSAAEMSATEVATAEVTAAVASAAAMATTAVSTAATAPRECAAGKDDRKHGDCHDKPRHWDSPAGFPREK